MDFDKANKLLTLIANFGVVAGIFFLAVEVRQNQEMLERDEQARQIEREMRISEFSDFAVSRYGRIRDWTVQDPELSVIWTKGLAGEALDPVDQSRFFSMCADRLWSEVLMWERSQILDRQVWQKAVVSALRDDLQTSAGFRRCWGVRQSTLTLWGWGEFVEEVNAGLNVAER